MKEFKVDDKRTLIERMAEYKNSHNVTNPFDPPKTLGMPKDKRSKEYKKVMAMDRCIKNVLSGFNTDAAFMAAPAFVGYAMLSNVSQEALIRAGVETVADEMTRKFIQWTYDDDDGEKDKEKELADLEEQAAKYKLKETFNDAALKDGYFGGCLVYIDLGELDDEEKEEPLVLDKKTFKPGSLKGFRVIEPINIYPGEYNTSDPTDEHYFNPEYWYILGKKYHASRFLYFAGNPTPVLLKPAYNFFGIPQAQLALDYVAHFVANRESAQELLNKFSLTCWKTDMTQALQGNSCSDLISRVKMFNRFKNNSGTMVLDKETEDMMQINTPLSGVRDIVDMSLSLLTAVWRIPKIKYLGEGEGGLNASSKEQMRSFYDYIMSQKEKLFTQPLETVLKIFQLNMGKDINKAIGFKYPDMWDMDDSEKAALNKQQADRDAVYLANGVLSQEEVRRRLSLDRNSEYTMIDVDDVPEPQAEPLKDVNEEEENETVKKAMDMALDGVKRDWRGRMAMDDRWITIGHRDGNGEDDEGRKGRHILLKEGETPTEAIERTTGTDIDKDGKVGKKDGGEEKKSEPKPEEKKEEKKAEPKPEPKEEPKKEEKKEPEQEKTPAIEYAELLDKEKASGLSDAEKARKKELEDKEGFGEKEKSIEEMTDEEIRNEMNEVLKKDKAINEKIDEAVNNDPKYLELRKEMLETEKKRDAAPWGSEERSKLNEQLDAVQKKVRARLGESYEDASKKYEKEQKELRARNSALRDEKEKRRKANLNKEKELMNLLDKKVLEAMKDDVSPEEKTKMFKEIDSLIENSGFEDYLKQGYRLRIETQKSKAEFAVKVSGMKDKIKNYSKNNDDIIKEFETFDDPFEKYNKEIEKEVKELDELRAKRDSEQDPDKKKELGAEVMKRVINSHFMDRKEDVNKVKYERTMAVANILRKQKNTGTQVVAGKSTIKGIYDKLNGVLGGVIGKNISTDNAPTVQALRGRAYYSASQNLFKVEKNADFGDVIHEYTHFLEKNNPQMLANSLAFAEYRTKGEEYKRMNEFSKGSGYGYDEIAKKDSFFNPYCGKIYSSDQEYRTARASEIMSMGVERLFREPAKFAKEDREYFDFVVANLRGEL